MPDHTDTLVAIPAGEPTPGAPPTGIWTAVREALLEDDGGLTGYRAVVRDPQSIRLGAQRSYNPTGASDGNHG